MAQKYRGSYIEVVLSIIRSNPRIFSLQFVDSDLDNAEVELLELQSISLSNVALRSQLAASEAWKSAVVDALVVSWEYDSENKDNPTQAIADLLAMAQREALDPSISEKQKALTDRAAASEKALAEAKGLLKRVDNEVPALYDYSILESQIRAFLERNTP